MTGQPYALLGARLFDGEIWHEDRALVVDGETVREIVQRGDLSADIQAFELEGGMLVPGFVDLQVNGGGGVMFNDTQNVETIRTVCAAHAPFGTTALMVTLITDTPEITSAAVAACAEAIECRVPGLLGLHLEGPHLSVARKGAHDPKLIRKMEEADLSFLIEAKTRIPALLSTVAVESVSVEQVKALAEAGIIVSLGHTEATYADAAARVAVGATMVTHLFNAMSQIGNREPGLAGAALNLANVSAGLIADGIHVDTTTIAIALRAKRQPGHIFLVTDAMATIGTEMTSFTLNGRTIHRNNGSLRLADGTLAGADLDMISAVRFIHRTVGADLGEALRMASLYPAQAIGCADRLGWLGSGSAASMVHLSDELDVQRVWTDGQRVV
jgi:N-acetylglucosamine-6-phosphate deacetylase